MNKEYSMDILVKYKSKGVLVDSNLLLLLIVGIFDQQLIPKYKRTCKYLPEDFEKLRSFLINFDRLITTPHILTEVSNLSNQLKGNFKPSYFHFFAEYICVLNERQIPSKDISKNKCFEKFGLTDAAIVEISKNSYLVITDDLSLMNFLASKKIDVVNLNHIRNFN